MITGVHALIYSKDAERLRAFFRDTLGWPSVDAGRGWLIFALPPAEIAMHPTEGEGSHELYLMCDDLGATVAELARKGVELARPIVTQVQKLAGFYPAEAYHQDYMLHHPNEPYIVYNDRPKVEHLKERFPQLYHERAGEN